MRRPTLTIMATFLLAATAGATTWHVPDQIPTIQAAIDTAVAGDVIQLADRTYTGDGNRDLSFQGKAIVVESASGDAESCIIDCGGGPGEPHGGFVFRQQETPASVLRNVTITGGYDDAIWRGGAISIGDPTGLPHAPTIQGCIFRDNHSDGGGAVHGAGGTIGPRFTGCTLAGNLAAGDGGGIRIQSYGEPLLENTIVWGNCAAGSGDAFELAEYVSLTCRCCDVDSTGIAGAGTVVWEAGNIFSDPLFCAPVDCSLAPTIEGDQRIASDSPCADALGCGQIGARGVGCPGSTPVTLTTWGTMKALFRD